MRTNALRYGFAIPCGVALIALACGETEQGGSGSGPTGMEAGASGGSTGSGGSGAQSGDAVGPASASVVSGSAVTSSAVANSAVTSSVVTSSTTTNSGAGGNANTSMGGSGNSAGGMPSSSVGGAAGAPMSNGCGDCEPTTESFGDDDCEVWICFTGEGTTQLSEAGCEALPTQVPRYCCPPGLSIECE